MAETSLADPDIRVASIVALRGVVLGEGPEKSYGGPWLDKSLERAPLTSLFLSLDPIVLLLNIAGWVATDLIVGPAPGTFDGVITVRFRDGWVDELIGTDAWWNEAGTDHPGTPWACAVRLRARTSFGPTVILGKGIEIDPGHAAFTEPADDDEALYFDRLLVISDPAAAFTDFVVAAHDRLFGEDGVRVALLEALLAVCEARQTDSRVASGLLGMYSPEYWWVPTGLDQSSATRAAMTEELAELGWALVEAQLGTITGFGTFLDEETWPTTLGGIGRPSMLERTKDLIEAGADPGLLALVEQWIAGVERHAEGARIRLRHARSMTYTQALFLAQSVGALDFLGTIGMEGARLDPEHAGGMYFNAPKTRSKQAADVRVLCFEAWTWWVADQTRARDALTRLRDALDEVERNLFVEVMLEDMRMWITMDHGKVDDAKALLRAAVTAVDDLADDPDVTEDEFRQTLDAISYALTVADPFWLEEWDTFGQDTWVGTARDFADAFIEGFVAVVEPALPDLAASARANLSNAMLGSLLQPIIFAGVIYGAAESIDATVASILPWIDAPVDEATRIVQSILDGFATVLSTEEEVLGDGLGRAAGGALLELARRVIEQPDPWHYAFEIGRIAGPLILDLVLELIFAAYAAPRLAALGLTALRKALDGLDSFRMYRQSMRTLASFDLPVEPLDGIYANVDAGASVAVGSGSVVHTWPEHPDVALTWKLDPDTRVHLVELDVEPATRDVVLETLGDPEHGPPMAKALDEIFESPGDEATHAAMLDRLAADREKANFLAAAGRVDPPIDGAELPEFDPAAPEVMEEKVIEAVADGSTTDPSYWMAVDENDASMVQRADDAFAMRLAAIRAEAYARHGITHWDQTTYGSTMGPHGPTQLQTWLAGTKTKTNRTLHKQICDQARAQIATMGSEWVALAGKLNACHLWPRSMGGPSADWNLVAGSARMNTSYIAIFENKARRLLADGEEVYLIVDVEYRDNGVPNALRHRMFIKSDAGVPILVEEMSTFVIPFAGDTKTRWLKQRMAERWLIVIPEA